MTKKKTILLIVLLLLLSGIFVGIGVLVTSSTVTETEAQSTQEEKVKIGNKEGAETLIDQTVSRDEIQETVGEWKKFELDGNGCERGVFAGKFYYENFILYSRTYDKGETFHVLSINE